MSNHALMSFACMSWMHRIVREIFHTTSVHMDRLETCPVRRTLQTNFRRKSGVEWMQVEVLLLLGPCSIADGLRFSGAHILTCYILWPFTTLCAIQALCENCHVSVRLWYIAKYMSSKRKKGDSHEHPANSGVRSCNSSERNL
jgi:hypothetical protein